jgi:hypothetical protein
MENYSQVKHLKNQLVIYNDESLSGFLFRLSQRNYYPNVSYLSNYLGLSTYQAQNNEFDQEAIRKLASLNEKLDYCGIYNGYNLQERLGSDLYIKIIMKNRVKYCPTCTQDKFYHRTIWGIILFHLCVEHRVKLVDQCPHCGHIISMAAFINQKCDRCFLEYNKAEPSRIENGSFLESQIQLTRGFWDEKITIIQNCNFINFMKLAFHSFHLLNGATDYTSLSSGVLSLFYNRLKGEKSGFELAAALANVHWMFKDFPNHYFIVLNDFLSRNRGKARYES